MMHVCLGVDEGMAIFVLMVRFNLLNVSLCKIQEVHIVFMLAFGFLKMISHYGFGF